jgi:hypothetical protein
MSLLSAWIVSALGVLIAAVLFVGLMNAWDEFADKPDARAGAVIGRLLLALGMPIFIAVAAIWTATTAYSDRQHAGQVCVKSQSYTTYVVVGHVAEPYTGTECVLWGKPAPATTAKGTP